MTKLIFAAVASIGVASAALAEYERVSLDRKIRDSDLIVIGTVSEIESVEAHHGSSDAAAMVTKKARLKVESILKGQPDQAEIVFGFCGYGSLELDDRIRCVALSPDGNWFAAGLGEGPLQIRNSQTGEVEHLLHAHGHRSFINSVAFSPDGTKVASGAGFLLDGVVKVWDTRTGAELHSLATERPVEEVSFAPSGKGIISEGGGQTIFWNLETQVETLLVDGKPTVQQFRKRRGRQGILNLSGGPLVAGGDDDSIRIWKLDPNKPTLSFPSYERFVENGRYLLFLRGVPQHPHCVTNWQYGIYRVVGNRVEDPRRPSQQLSWRRLLRGSIYATSNNVDPLEYSAGIMLEDAVSYVEEAIEVTRSQIELGEFKLQADRASIVLEVARNSRQIHVRLPRREPCPPFDTDRITAAMLRRDGSALRPIADASETIVPVSVDPLGFTTELTFNFAGDVGHDGFKSVQLIVDGRPLSFCIPNAASNDCQSSGGSTCQACHSRALVPLSDGRPHFDRDRDPCDRSKPVTTYNKGCIVRSQKWHCRACGFEW